MLETKRKVHLEEILDEEHQSEVRPVIYKRGDYLYRELEKPKGIFYVVRGVLGLTRSNLNGGETLLRVFSDEGFCGHRSFMAGDHYQASAQVLKEAEVIFIDKKLAEHLLTFHHEFTLLMAQDLAKDLKNAEGRLADMVGKSATRRVIEGLFYLKDKTPEFNWTRRDIGDFCGVKSETVSRTLSDLEGRGLISRDKRSIRIEDEETLLEYLKTIL